MPGFLDVEPSDIARLSGLQLTDFLRRLLYLEPNRLGLPGPAIQVSLKIDVPDGGENGQIELEVGPEPSGCRWLPGLDAYPEVA